MFLSDGMRIAPGNASGSPLGQARAVMLARGWCYGQGLQDGYAAWKGEAEGWGSVVRLLQL
eukprot:7327622-Alexandrium_andersonii.AAC.1